MTTGRTVRALLVDDQVLVEQADGSYRPAEMRTDWEQVKNFSEDDVEAMAIEDLCEDFWEKTEPRIPDKAPVFMKLDADILKYFRAAGRGYQTRINAVLRSYVEAQQRG